MIVIRTKYGSLTRGYRLLTRLASLTATLRIFCFPPANLLAAATRSCRASDKSIVCTNLWSSRSDVWVHRTKLPCRLQVWYTYHRLGYDKFVTKILKDLKVLRCLEKLFVFSIHYAEILIWINFLYLLRKFYGEVMIIFHISCKILQSSFHETWSQIQSSGWAASFATRSRRNWI